MLSIKLINSISNNETDVPISASTRNALCSISTVFESYSLKNWNIFNDDQQMINAFPVFLRCVEFYDKKTKTLDCEPEDLVTATESAKLMLLQWCDKLQCGQFKNVLLYAFFMPKVKKSSGEDGIGSAGKDEWRLDVGAGIIDEIGMVLDNLNESQTDDINTNSSDPKLELRHWFEQLSLFIESWTQNTHNLREILHLIESTSKMLKKKMLSCKFSFCICVCFSFLFYCVSQKRFFVLCFVYIALFCFFFFDLFVPSTLSVGLASVLDHTCHPDCCNYVLFSILFFFLPAFVISVVFYYYF